uniref:Uncharacterized protein n=2 Tax=Agrobacterium TaxID=357 RepID=A0A2Z2Q999_9HYPH|nr:hypothetical protein [Agrobacterium larrymoorei]
MPEWMAAMATSIVWEFAGPMRRVRRASPNFPSRWRLRFQIGYMSSMHALVRQKLSVVGKTQGPVTTTSFRARTR